MGRPRSSQPEAPFEGVLRRLHEPSAPDARALRRTFVRSMMRAVARRLFDTQGLRLPIGARLFTTTDAERGSEARLAELERHPEQFAAAVDALLASCPADTQLSHALGAAFEALASFELSLQGGEARLSLTRRRKRTGTFYTPAHLAEKVAATALAELERSRGKLGLSLAVCDPACGSGAFLVETARALFERLRKDSASPATARELRREIACRMLTGVDVDPDALAIAELALWAFVADPKLPASAIAGLYEGDALTGPGLNGRAVFDESGGFDWSRALAASAPRGFELVIGNPPWVAFAGRAAQPLAPARRGYFARHYPAFRGYPTLQALFVERALELAPEGVLALLVPSPLADLDGYRAVRRLLFQSHTPCEPLLEFGGDAFTGVTQPCFALVARPRSDASQPVPERALALAERPRIDAVARTIDAPAVLARFADAESLPRELFGELGLQTTRLVSERLLLRAAKPSGKHVYPLLEGRNVKEFTVSAPQLFLDPDRRVLEKARCRLREADAYSRVRFVVRQTAKAPIAALHSGLPFRNSLLAGFEVPGYPPELVVGLLNSSLYRALHLARQRDGRQSVFPQVKIGHLRSLPRPPSAASARFAEIIELTRAASAAGENLKDLRMALDSAVFSLFEVEQTDRQAVLAFLRARAPELGF